MTSSTSLWRRLILFAAAAAAVTAVTAALAGAVDEPPPDPAAADSVTATAAGETTTTHAAPCAYLGVWQGRLAVFRPGNPQPEEVCEVFVSSLPAAEQAALAARFPVYSEVELQKRLEDYTG